MLSCFAAEEAVGARSREDNSVDLRGRLGADLLSTFSCCSCFAAVAAVDRKRLLGTLALVVRAAGAFGSLGEGGCSLRAVEEAVGAISRGEMFG